MYSKRHLSAEDDPLTRAMAPPPNETIQERDARIHKEREAKKVSDEIDEELKKGHKKGLRPVKILLLGRSAFELCINESIEGCSRAQARANPVRTRP
jgi:guanine nucleotide-binding protein subunit alpha